MGPELLGTQEPQPEDADSTAKSAEALEDDEEPVLPVAGIACGTGVAEFLLSFLPIFRLGLEHTVLCDVVHLREAPSFFTADMHEKQFSVSLASVTERVLSTWRSDPAAASAILRGECCLLGVGCSLDISRDDKAI